MVTAEQLQAMPKRAELHYGECKREVGKRGAEYITVSRVRKNGDVQTWKRRPGAFRAPFKYGLKQGVQITEENAHLFHLPTDCPIGAR
jgi:hypothetical protein